MDKNMLSEYAKLMVKVGANVQKGADEIDYVINVAELKNKDYDYIKKEMEEIVKICREAGNLNFF